MTVLSINRTFRITLILFMGLLMISGTAIPTAHASGEGSFVTVKVNNSCGQILTEGEVNITISVREPSQVKVIIVSPSGEDGNGFSKIWELEPMLVEDAKNITFNLMGPPGLWSVLAIANSTLTLTPYASNICNVQVIHRKGFKQGRISRVNITDTGNRLILKIAVENNGTLEEKYGLKLINVTGCNPTSIDDIEVAPNNTKILSVKCDYPSSLVNGTIILYRAGNESFIYDVGYITLQPKKVPVLNETPIRVRIPREIFLRLGQKGDTFSIKIENRASSEMEIHPTIQVDEKGISCEIVNESLIISPKGEGALKIKCKTLKAGRYSLRLSLEYFNENLGRAENLSRVVHLVVSSQTGMGSLRIKSIRPSDLIVNKTYRISIEFENVGSQEMQNVTVNLALKNNLAKLRSSQLYIQSLKPGESKEMRFELETLSTGNETLEVLVEYRTENGSLIEDRLEVPLTIRSSQTGMGSLPLEVLIVAAALLTSLLLLYRLRIRRQS